MIIPREMNQAHLDSRVSMNIAPITDAVHKRIFEVTKKKRSICHLKFIPSCVAFGTKITNKQICFFIFHPFERSTLLLLSIFLNISKICKIRQTIIDASETRRYPPTRMIINSKL